MRTIGIPLGRRHPSVHVFVVLGACLVAAILGMGLGSRGNYTQELIVVLSLGALAGVIIMLRPIYGISLFAAGATVGARSFAPAGRATRRRPHGRQYGPGFSGHSDGWVAFLS